MKLSSAPYQPILDRDELPTKVADTFADTQWLLRDVVSYGGLLIPRCYNESANRTIKDAVILLSRGSM
jgi:hypothetical protein